MKNLVIMRSNISLLKILTTNPNVMIMVSGKVSRIRPMDREETIPIDIVSNRIE